ncbi:unnamed protein product [Clonostachys rosea]|uniref:BZIP domain-containing protein n=1 Tax=Bionectria ochroleuca TaxID=29856 RepID=A0ABY6USJ7_BIOOC|nr:unnamed protein product [Clonostachys rosea]
MTANRASIVGTGGAGSHLSALLDHGSANHRPRRQSALDLARKPGRRIQTRKSASDLLDAQEDFQRQLDSPVLAPHMQKHTATSDGVSDLIDFLRNQTPPPDHFMSMPDHADGEERGRSWPRWKKGVRRSRSLPKRRPPPIRLPDTAVSGTTIGGHRHIAITIPFDALPMGDIPRSQYPVYQKDAAAKPNGLNQNPVRAYVNERGVVTVLRTVKEDRETSNSSNGSEAPVQKQPPITILPRTPSYGASRPNTKGHLSVPPSRGSINSSIQETPQRLQGASRGYPARASSVNNRPIPQQQHVSIEGVLSKGNATITSSDIRTATLQSIRPTSRSKVAPESRVSRLIGSQIDLDSKPLPSLPSKEEQERAEYVEGKETEPPTSSQVETALQHSLSTKSRRDRVRDRKRRDIEAHLNTKSLPQEEHRRLQTPVYDSEPRTSEESEVVNNQEHIASLPTFIPIQVVCSLEPTPSPSETAPPPRMTLRPEPKTPTRQIISIEDELNDASVSQEPLAKSLLDSSNDPTPPLSAKGSPVRRNSALDRTSLSRRREWRASRETERQNREARATMQARARKLAMEAGDRAKEEIPVLDKEIMRLYEAYREHRFRDMERRLRRLERNGDVWLRALVPVLDSLNQSVVTSNRDESDARGWASDGEESAAYAIKKEAQRRASASVRRPSSAHSYRNAREQGLVQKLEEVLEDDMESRCCSSRGSDEVSGLDIIEPLMRELAGAAKVRQMRSKELLHAC